MRDEATAVEEGVTIWSDGRGVSRPQLSLALLASALIMVLAPPVPLLILIWWLHGGCRARIVGTTDDAAVTVRRYRSTDLARLLRAAAEATPSGHVRVSFIALAENADVEEAGTVERPASS